MPLPVSQLQIVSSCIIREAGEVPVSGFEVALEFRAEGLLGVDYGDGRGAVAV
jgi:hypothetical protein